VVAAATTAAFLLLHLAPGDPFSSLDDQSSYTREMRETLQRQWGYGEPLPRQFLVWIGNVARGTLGWSHSQQQTVEAAIGIALPNTLLLMGLGFTASLIVGVLLGAWQGAHAGSPGDRAISTATLGMYSVPEFVLGIALLLLFVSWLDLLPASGMTGDTSRYMPFGERLFDGLTHLVLPTMALTIVGAGVVARFQRAAMRDTMSEPFVRTARAKGLSEFAVQRAALRASLLPVITLAGLFFPALLGGAVIVEKVFGWPGMGTLLLDGIHKRDYWLVTGIVVIGSAMTAVGTLLADVARALADPRVDGA
jgi:peptide/nickel transport system permease protein